MFDVTKDADLFELSEKDFVTVLASDISFTGTISFSKPFMVMGNITGKIDSDGDIVIDSSAAVKADITASRVLVRGKVHGNIQSTRLIYVTKSGYVEGDVTTAQLVLEPGSFFSGRCTTVR